MQPYKVPMPLSIFDFKNPKLVQLAIFREITSFFSDEFQPYALIWAYALISYFKIVLSMLLFKTTPLFGSLEYVCDERKCTSDCL